MTFLVGRNGEFDPLAASVVHCCQRVCRSDNRSLIGVMPYMTAEYRDNQETFQNYYDEIEICEESDRKRFKTAFQIRNRHMVDHSDFSVFLCSTQGRCTWQAFQYAKQIGKIVVCVDQSG